MRTTRLIFILSMIIGALSGFTSVVALCSGIAGDHWNYTTVRGEEVVIFGEGIYRYDSLFNALGFIAQDFIFLFLGIPLLIIMAIFYFKKKGGANSLLLSILGFFLYAYASLCLGAALNRLFLLYITIFSSSLLAFALLLKESSFSQIAMKEFPRKGFAIYLILSGCITLVIWGIPLIEAAYFNSSPMVQFHYTTLVTHALDLSIIVPASIISGLLVLRGNSLGYKMALPILGIIIFLVPMIILTTYFQLTNGVILSVEEMAGPVAGFVILGGFGIYFLLKIFSQIRFAFSSQKRAR